LGPCHQARVTLFDIYTSLDLFGLPVHALARFKLHVHWPQAPF
jgi:hypothetical protein